MAKKNKYPKTIDVCGHTFKIKMYKRSPKDISDVCPAEAWCDWDNREIGLVEKYTKKDHSSLFHELGHAAADAVKVPNALANEAFARPFFAVFYAALRSAGLIK